MTIFYIKLIKIPSLFTFYSQGLIHGVIFDFIFYSGQLRKSFVKGSQIPAMSTLLTSLTDLVIVSSRLLQQCPLLPPLI